MVERGCRGNINMKRAHSGVSATYIEVRKEGVVHTETWNEHTTECPLYTLKPGKRVSGTQKHETCTQRSIRSIHMYKSVCMYARACRLQESFLYNWLLAIEHYGLSDNSESNVDVTTGSYECLKYFHVVDVRWELVGRDIRNQKTNRCVAMRSCEAYTSSH